ncbi:hypothetical protein NEILACOT_04353 [Neisseria lactamica ATCC 23970]|uniref:Uncharacterized protein n=1 Tax=Neisseria lactamica ATCC 23970 TaxID=546265 RepID=D0W9Y8_NEILA|nr:hypothetical protein NEILACOT_04353 [Neisseria lactamica ATCC 23970]
MRRFGSKGRILSELYAAPVSDDARGFVIMRRRVPFQTAFFCFSCSDGL